MLRKPRLMERYLRRSGYSTLFPRGSKRRPDAEQPGRWFAMTDANQTPLLQTPHPSVFQCHCKFHNIDYANHWPGRRPVLAHPRPRWSTRAPGGKASLSPYGFGARRISAPQTAKNLAAPREPKNDQIQSLRPGPIRYERLVRTMRRRRHRGAPFASRLVHENVNLTAFCCGDLPPDGLSRRKAAFSSVYPCFSGAINLARPALLLLKDYCAGFGIKKSHTIG